MANEPLSDSIERIIRGVGAFADDMRAQGIHVGLGATPRCVTCGEPWPCAASKDYARD